MRWELAGAEDLRAAQEEKIVREYMKLAEKWVRFDNDVNVVTGPAVGQPGLPVQTPATGRGGSPAARSGALGIGGNRGGARRSRQGEAFAHETA